MAKCPACNGTGRTQMVTLVQGADFPCIECSGTGEVEMTNEYFLRTATTEQLAEWLQEHMDCASCGCNKDLCYQGYDCCKLAFVEWLKQPHMPKE